MPKVLSVEKALDLLDLIAAAKDGLGTREIARRLGINITTVHNIAATMRDRGYLRQDTNSRKFKLGMRILRLGQSDRLHEAMAEAALPYIQNLVGTVGETVLLAALRGGAVVHLASIRSPHALRVDERGGIAINLYSTAYGKVLLAAMSKPALEAYLVETPPIKLTPRTLTTRREILDEVQRVRQRGYATTVDEAIEGVSAVAVPVVDSSGRTVAAIGVSAPTFRFNQTQRRKVLEELQHATKKIASLWFEILDDQNPEQ